MCKRHTFFMLFFIIFMIILSTTCKKTSPPFECTDAIGCVNIAPSEPIEISALLALSGGTAPLGLEQTRSIELAIAQQGDQLLEHPIKLHVEDARCLPEGGTNAALKVITRPEIIAILGTSCSDAAVTASEIMSEAGLTMISGGNSAPSLTAIGEKKGEHWQPGYFRTRYNDATMGRVAAVFVFQELGIMKAATLNDGDVYTQGLTGVFEQVFTESGGEIVLSATINKGDTDMQPVLTAVTTSGAEILFSPIFQPEGDFIVQQAKKMSGLNDLILMSAASLLIESFVKSIHSDGVGMYFVGPTPPQGKAHDDLIRMYRSRYGELPSTTTYDSAFDATKLLLQAIEAVAIQEKDGTLHIGRQTLRDKLYNTENFEGVTGRLTCNKFGDCSETKFNIVRLDDPETGIEGLLSNVTYTYTPE